jgi:hypothetical protein
MISEHDAEYQRSLRLLSRDRQMMANDLSRIPGLTVFPSQGNFILVKLPTEWSGVALRDYLVANHAVYTRECGNKLGMTSQFMRLVVRPTDDVDRLIDGMRDYGGQWRGAEPAYADDPLDDRWGRVVEEPPDNLIPYPTLRSTEFGLRRAVAR